MRAGRPSRTAEQNAAFRAAESWRPSGVRLLNDPYAAQLLPAGLRALAWLSSAPIAGGGLNWFVESRWPGARSSIIARTRLIDEGLCEAVGAGVKQMVLLGAGFDIGRGACRRSPMQESSRWTIRRHRQKNGAD